MIIPPYIHIYIIHTYIHSIIISVNQANEAKFGRYQRAYHVEDLVR